MATVIRPELSKKNKYWIPKYRYYELKYFCLQYPEWRKELAECEERIVHSNSLILRKREKSLEDRVSEIAIRKNSLERKMDLIVECCKLTDLDIWSFLLKAVTEGMSWTHLYTRLRIPCGRDYYYERRHKFFYILSNKLQAS